MRADAGQLEQVILNLAINGRDAMPGGGDLLIETASVELDEAYAEAHSEIRPGRYVLLAVSDRGTGLSDEARQHLFEPFYTTKPAGRGTGLGLATVYGIVRQSGGHIVVFSEQEIGTTFRVYLPQVGPPSAPVATKPAAASVRRAPMRKPRTGATILVAEDDPSVRALLESVLAGRGHRVLAAPHGAAALLLASRHTGPVDLLVSDIVMPGMTGPQLAGELLRGRPDVPVLFVSGFSDAETVDRARVGRHSAFLPKPFAPDALLARVDELLGAPHGGSR